MAGTKFLISILVLVALMGLTQMARSQPQSCSAQLANLNVCAPFVVPGAANTNPTPDCCGALQAVEHDCICNTVRIASRLPSLCNLAPLSCNVN